MSGPKYCVVRGFKFASGFKDNAESGLQYVARDDDIFIVTYPKNGTTWTQQITTLVLNHGKFPEIAEQKGLYEVSPFLEAQGKEAAEKVTRPAAIKTHLPPHLQPWNDEAKYIITIRNPKDACVSFYYHTTMFPDYEFVGRPFSDFFPFWLDGNLECGSYFDWTLSWWNMRDKPNVLILLYEEMKTNPREAILKLARFLDEKYEKELSENNFKVLNDVIEKSSFKHMQETTNKKFFKRHHEKNPPEKRVPEDKFNFIRKGVIGDWSNHFTKEQNEKLEEVFRQKFAGTELLDMWNDYGFFSSQD